MNQIIRKMILHCPLTREVFFLLKGKKVNKNAVDRKIKKFKETKDKQVLKDVVVSLTSYGTRLNELQYTLFSLIDQTVKPEKIIVNLAQKDFDSIPTKLKTFEKFGVSFVKTEDLKSYKKLIPTLNTNPDKCIVTADDDLYYPRTWLEKLWIAHQKNPKNIICHLTAKIQYEENNLFPYVTWPYNKEATEPSLKNLILSGCGTLFPPKSLYKDITEITLFQKLSPAADDIWDYFMAYLNKTKIEQIPDSYINVKYVNPYREYGLEVGQTLTQINVGLGKNDEQFKAIMDNYGIMEKEFIKTIQDIVSGGCKLVCYITMQQLAFYKEVAA